MIDKDTCVVFIFIMALGPLLCVVDLVSHQRCPVLTVQQHLSHPMNRLSKALTQGQQQPSISRVNVVCSSRLGGNHNGGSTQMAAITWVTDTQTDHQHLSIMIDNDNINTT